MYSQYSMYFQYPTSSQAPSDTDSLTRGIGQGGQSVVNGPVAFTPNANPHTPGLSPELFEQEIINAQVAKLMHACETCQGDTRIRWDTFVESCRLGPENSLQIPIKPSVDDPKVKITECQAWVSSWRGSHVRMPCARDAEGGSLFCDLHKHAITDHHISTVEESE